MSRTMGDLAVTELIRFARQELADLTRNLGDSTTLVQRAYLSTIGTRLCVAEDKLTEYLAQEREAVASAVTTPEPVTPTVTGYSVKIWYRSGAYEGAPHCPEDLARKIFANAVQSAGVEFAELHGRCGELLAMKGRDGLVATTEPEPNENRFLAGLPLLHPELNVSQHGENLTDAYSAQEPAEENHG